MVIPLTKNDLNAYEISVKPRYSHVDYCYITLVIESATIIINSTTYSTSTTTPIEFVKGTSITVTASLSGGRCQVFTYGDTPLWYLYNPITMPWESSKDYQAGNKTYTTNVTIKAQSHSYNASAYPNPRL